MQTRTQIRAQNRSQNRPATAGPHRRDGRVDRAIHAARAARAAIERTAAAPV